MLAVFALLIATLVAAFPAWAVEEDKDTTTPRRAVATFMQSAEAEDWARAASVLDLKLIAPSQRTTKGTELSKELHRILVTGMWVDLDAISDDPAGKPTDGADTETIGKVLADGKEVPIVLARSKTPPQNWFISSSTVSRVPMMYEDYAPSWLETRMPRFLSEKAWGLATWQWIGLVVAIVLGVAIGRAVAWLLGRILQPLADRTPAKWDDELLQRVRSPARLLLALLSFRALLAPLALAAAPQQVVHKLAGIVAIGGMGWLAIRVTTVLSHLVEVRAGESAKGVTVMELRARGVTTQVRVLRRVMNVAVGIVTIALMLTQFEVVRNLGVSLLASAGLAGVVLGFAAQRTFGSLIAGIQLSATQPIRIGDAVVVEKEFGTIEEITLTYVVVKIWDERRLIVPVSRFLEQPFENWTKTTAELHGTVFLHADWTLPVDLVRKELTKILEGTTAWDKRTALVHVSDAKEKTLEVRILVSARSASALSDLRFFVRERLVMWLQNYEEGKFLPRLRHDTTEDEGPPRPGTPKPQEA